MEKRLRRGVVCVWWLLPIIVALTSGCTGIARRVALNLQNTSLDREIEIGMGRGSGFVRCFRARGGGCPATRSSLDLRPLSTRMPDALDGGLEPMMGFAADEPGHPIRVARAVLEHPVTQNLVTAYNGLVAPELGGPVTVPLTLDWDGLEELDLLLNRATQVDAWTALADYVEQRAEGLRGDPEVDSYVNLTGYLKEYFKSYFRNGKFFTAKVDVSGLKERIKQELMGRYSLGEGDPKLTELVEEIVKKYYAGVKDEYVFWNIEDVGFVTRSGSEYQFPAIEAKLDPTADRPLTVTDVDPLLVANDLLRVFLEGVLDSKHGLPIVSNATARALGQVVNDPTMATSPESAHLLAEHFAEVDNWANRAEGATTAVVGRVVRGAGWIALNNESLAGMLETIVGVFVRKVTEKVAWCVYSCDSGSGDKSAYKIDSRKTLRVVVQGPPAHFLKGRRKPARSGAQ